jgi:hypothetical protein
MRLTVASLREKDRKKGAADATPPRDDSTVSAFGDFGR